MPYTNGRVSFTRLLVNTSDTTPTRTLTEDALDKLNEHAFSATDIGVPLETEAGWTTAEHLLDTHLTHDAVSYDGGALALLGLRTDTNTPPADVRRALRAQHEQALARDNPSGKPSKAQRAEAKAAVDQELAEQMAEGKFRRSSLNQVLWDLPGRSVLSAAASNTALETLAERFRLTFGGSLAPASAGLLGYRHLAATGRDRDYEDLRPSAFTDPPAIARSAEESGPATFGPSGPECPWAHASGEPRDFLGNELLIWLWFTIDQREGIVEMPDPDNRDATATLAVTMDRALEMECAWGINGKLTLRDHAGGPAPVRLAEAAEALALGKWPRKTGLVIADNSAGEEAGQVWTLTLHADRWIVTAATLPAPLEDAGDGGGDPRAEREHRLERTLRLDKLLLGLYHRFLDLRTSPEWDEERRHIRSWIADHRRRRVKSPGLVEGKPAERVAASA